MNNGKHPFVSLAELERLGYRVKNEMIEGIDINLIGHFGNAVTLEVMVSQGVLFSCYNMTRSIGLVLDALYELLDLTEEDGKRLSDIENVPCRVVVDSAGCRVGIGNFMEDKFLLEDDIKNVAKKVSDEK